MKQMIDGTACRMFYCAYIYENDIGAAVSSIRNDNIV